MDVEQQNRICTSIHLWRDLLLATLFVLLFLCNVKLVSAEWGRQAFKKYMEQMILKGVGGKWWWWCGFVLFPTTGSPAVAGSAVVNYKCGQRREGKGNKTTLLTWRSTYPSPKMFCFAVSKQWNMTWTLPNEAWVPPDVPSCQPHRAVLQVNSGKGTGICSWSFPPHPGSGSGRQSSACCVRVPQATWEKPAVRHQRWIKYSFMLIQPCF